MSNKLYILCGIPFSGKTTLAKRMVDKFGFTRIDLDEVKFDLFSSSITDSEIDQSGWDKVYQEMYRRIRESLNKGETVIHDTGNFTKYERGLVKKIADDLGIESITIFVDISEEEAYKRLLENRTTGERFDVDDADFVSTVSEMEKPRDDEKHIIYHRNDDFDSWTKSNIV
jgi:predicted kinase